MKIKLLVAGIAFLFTITVSNAQRVSVRIGFPVGAHTYAPSRAPFTGAVWIGPEWVWRGGRYECVPGYWARPQRHGAIWVTGHWKYNRRGYVWVPGHWR